MSEKIVFHNSDSGETFLHLQRDDGKRDLKFGVTGSSLPGHAVLDQNGNVNYLRNSNGHVVADNNLG